MNHRRLSTHLLFGLAASVTSVIMSLAPASAQTLYVTDSGDNTVKRITPNGVVSTFISAGLKAPVGLTFDTQGNLFVGNAAGTVPLRKYNSAGVQQPFTLSGNPLRNPFALNFDAASGDLFAISFAANGIDTIISRITSAGVVSTLVADAGVSSAFDLARDASGNLYTVNYNDNTVVKYNSAGVAQPFPLSGDPLDGPQGLTFDPLGNLYVTNVNTNTVSKITSAGVVSTFLTGLELNGPQDIERDSAGNLYVINASDSTISKYNSAGVLQPFPLSGDSLAFPSLMAIQSPVASAAPEPASFALLALSGLPLVGMAVRRRRSVCEGYLGRSWITGIPGKGETV